MLDTSGFIVQHFIWIIMMELDNSDAKTKKNSSGAFISITGIVLYIHYLTTFAWSHKCLTEVGSTSHTNLSIIPHRELRLSSGALSDASTKTIFSLSALLCYRRRCLSPAWEDRL